MRPQCGLLLLVLVCCDASGSDTAEGGETQSSERRSIEEVCEEYCPTYLGCYDDEEAIPTCLEACVNDSQGDATCEAALVDWYECRLDNLCDGPECDESAIDAACPDG